MKIKAWGSGGFYKDGKRVSGTGPDRLEDFLSRDEPDLSSTFDKELWGPGFDSPEEAALSGYPPDEARVLEVFEDAGDRVTLIVEVNPSTGYSVYEHCERHVGRWYDRGHSG